MKAVVTSGQLLLPLVRWCLPLQQEGEVGVTEESCQPQHLLLLFLQLPA